MSRVSTFQITQESLYGIQDSYSRYEKYSNQLSTGKQLTNPSDDPVGTALTLDYRQQSAELDQFGKTINQAKGFLSQTENALDSVNTLIRTARSLALQGANDTQTQDSRDALATQVDNIIKQVATLGNTQYGSQYIFAGQQTQTAPIVATGAGVYTYAGGKTSTGDGQIVLDIGRNDSVQVNTTGDTTIIPILNTLKSLRDNLSTGNARAITAIDLDNLDKSLSTITSVRADFGAKVQRLTQTQNRNDQSKVNFSKFISDIEDTDTAQAVVSYQSAQSTYQAALKVTAGIVQYSLLDFIK